MNSWLACSGPTWRRGDLCAENLCHQAIFVDDATRAVMPPDPEMILKGAITPS